MPALKLETLRREAQALAALAEDPAAFVSRWQEMGEEYADRTRRAGQAVKRPTLPVLHLPKALMNAVEQAVRGRLAAEPELALPLADALWEQENWESRLLAAKILGFAPPQAADEVFERLWRWAETAATPELREAVINHGSARLAAEAPTAYLNALLPHLRNRETAALALQALLPLLNSPRFVSTPPVFDALLPLITPPPPELRPELAAVLRALARRWPRETAPFLQTALSLAPGPQLDWLVRRVEKLLNQ